MTADMADGVNVLYQHTRTHTNTHVRMKHVKNVKCDSCSSFTVKIKVQSVYISLHVVLRRKEVFILVCGINMYSMCVRQRLVLV